MRQEEGVPLLWLLARPSGRSRPGRHAGPHTAFKLHYVFNNEHVQKHMSICTS